MLVDDRKKLGMFSADPQNCSSGFRGRLVRRAQPSIGGFKMDDDLHMQKQSRRPAVW